jgi:hypothetical protein
MQEQTTYPALLAIETVPAALMQSSALADQASTAKQPVWPGLVLKALALAAAVWVILGWW